MAESDTVASDVCCMCKYSNRHDNVIKLTSFDSDYLRLKELFDDSSFNGVELPQMLDCNESVVDNVAYWCKACVGGVFNIYLNRVGLRPFLGDNAWERRVEVERAICGMSVDDVINWLVHKRNVVLLGTRFPLNDKRELRRNASLRRLVDRAMKFGAGDEFPGFVPLICRSVSEDIRARMINMPCVGCSQKVSYEGEGKNGLG